MPVGILTAPVEITVPATSANLGAGFDCFGLALSLYNKITLIPSDVFEIAYTGAADSRNIPLDKTNLLYRSMEKVFSLYNKSLPSFKILVENNIPVSRGLGSSSSVIVAGIAAANYLLDTPLSLQAMLNLANSMEGHPDNITPALVGGFTVAFCDQDQVYYKKLVWPSQWFLTAIVPEVIVSTESARTILPHHYPLQDAVHNIQRSSLLIAAIYEQDAHLLKIALADKLHEPYRYSLIPYGFDIQSACKALESTLGIVLSGSGSTLLLISDQYPDIDPILKTYWGNEGISYTLKSLKAVSEGIFLKT